MVCTHIRCFHEERGCEFYPSCVSCDVCTQASSAEDTRRPAATHEAAHQPSLSAAWLAHAFSGRPANTQLSTSRDSAGTGLPDGPGLLGHTDPGVRCLSDSSGITRPALGKATASLGERPLPSLRSPDGGHSQTGRPTRAGTVPGVP